MVTQATIRPKRRYDARLATSVVIWTWLDRCLRPSTPRPHRSRAGTRGRVRSCRAARCGQGSRAGASSAWRATGRRLASPELVEQIAKHRLGRRVDRGDRLRADDDPADRGIGFIDKGEDLVGEQRGVGEEQRRIEAIQEQSGVGSRVVVAGCQERAGAWVPDQHRRPRLRGSLGHQKEGQDDDCHDARQHPDEDDDGGRCDGQAELGAIDRSEAPELTRIEQTDRDDRDDPGQGGLGQRGEQRRQQEQGHDDQGRNDERADLRPRAAVSRREASGLASVDRKPSRQGCPDIRDTKSHEFATGIDPVVPTARQDLACHA